MNVYDENDSFFLDLLVKHPNLYNEQHQQYNNLIASKGSWGQIGLALGITGKQAEDKWHQLLEVYQEECALKECEAAADVHISPADKSPYDFLFDKIHLLLRPRAPPPSSEKHKSTKISAKSRLLKTTIKAQDASKQVEEKLQKVTLASSLSCNAKVGKLIELELLQLSPKSRTFKRQLIIQNIEQFLDYTINN